MYIAKVQFPPKHAFPIIQVIDSAVVPPDPQTLGHEVIRYEDKVGFVVNRDSFSCGIARELVSEFFRYREGVQIRDLRYQYKDGELPDATFVFEYERSLR